MNTVARAFELAQSGRFRNITELRKALVAEGVPDVDAHFCGLGFKTQLRQTIAAATASR